MCTRGGWRRDPAAKLSADALKTYGHVVRSGILAAGVLERLFGAGNERSLRTKSWTLVRDPIAAIVLKAARIEFRFKGPWRVREPSGLLRDVRDVSSLFLAERARFPARSSSDKLALGRIEPATAWEGDVFWRPFE